MNILLNGLLPISWTTAVFILLGLTHLTILTVTLYLHRACAHRAVDFPLWLSHAFRFWSWMTTGMTARQWASVHRKHHAKCETEEDPHSPQRKGLGTVLFKGVALYKKAAKDPDVIKRYGNGTPSDRMEDFYENWTTTGIIAMIAIEILLFGVPKAAMIGIGQIIWIPLWAAGFINGIGHYWGYRNFNSPDASRNILPIAIFIGGEELHNNHHAFPSSAKLSNKAWEFDWGWTILKMLEAVGWARIKKIAPQVRKAKAAAHSEITLEHLKAIATCRFDAMREAKKSLSPMIKKQLEQVKFKSQLNQKIFLSWFFFENARTHTEQEKLLCAEIIAQNPVLTNMRLLLSSLIETWTVAHNNAQVTLDHFKKWCIDAEASGIEGLASLSTSLRSYRLAPPR